MGGSRRSAKPCSFAVARHSLLNLMKPIRIGCIVTDLIFSHHLEFPTFHAKQLTIDHRCADIAARVFDNPDHV